MLGGPHHPGFQTRFVPPSGFLTLLTVSSLASLPISRIGAARGVHPSELFPPAEPYASRRLCPLAVSDITFSCSEDQEIMMPRGSRALFPARIRALSGPKPGGPMLSWVSGPLQSVRHTPWKRLPVPSLMRFRRPDSEEPRRPALQGIAGHATRRFLTVPPTLLRFATRTLTSASPAEGSAPLGCPTGSE
jgi:hypothetical protein